MVQIGLHFTASPLIATLQAVVLAKGFDYKHIANELHLKSVSIKYIPLSKNCSPCRDLKKNRKYRQQTIKK